MGTVLAGALVITAFLVSSVLMFQSFLTSSVGQSQSMRDFTKVKKEFKGSSLEITNAAVNVPGGSEVWVHVDNTGSEPVASFGEMDVIIQYTGTDNNLKLTYLTYNAGGAGANEWTVSVTGVQPDDFNPRMWDSDETLAIDLQVAPAIKAGTPALIIVATPWGVNDQRPITNP